MVHELHAAHRDVGLVMSVCAALEIPLMLMTGALSKKISNHALIMMGCGAAFLYYLILSASTHSWQLIAAQLLQATFVAIVMGNGISYFTERLPHSPGIAVTIYSNAGTIGRLAGTLGGGFLAQFAGYRHVYEVCLVLVMFSFVILWRTRPYKEMEVHTGHSQSM